MFKFFIKDNNYKDCMIAIIKLGMAGMVQLYHDFAFSLIKIQWKVQFYPCLHAILVVYWEI